jgi:hypothetical protein
LQDQYIQKWFSDINNSSKRGILFKIQNWIQIGELSFAIECCS